MKKILVTGLVLLFSVSACVPDFLKSDTSNTPAEAVDIAETVDAAANTQVAQTFEALNSPTAESTSAGIIVEEAPATETPLFTATVLSTETETATADATETPSPTGTLATETASTTPDGTLSAETATETPNGTLVPSGTGTIEATETSIYPSPTSPISINIPPKSVPRHQIRVVNQTKGRIYISLQGVTVGDYHPIIEYDLPPWQKADIRIPEGWYTAIVYVGKDPMVSSFKVRDSNITIFIKRDQIQIKK